MYINLFRKIKSLLLSGKSVQAKSVTFTHNKIDLIRDVNIVYQDGLYSLNNDAKLFIQENDKKEAFSSLLEDDVALNIINDLKMEDKDIFLGRKDNYLFFKDLSKSLKIVNQILDVNSSDLISLKTATAQLIIDDKIEIKNATTDLKSLELQILENYKTFLTQLNNAIASNPSYNLFQTAIAPIIATAIANIESDKILVNSLLK